MARVSGITIRRGERALYHAPRRWIPASLVPEAVAYGAALAVAALLGLLSFDPPGLLALAAALAGLLGFTLHGWIDGWSQEILVTDRRLVHRGGWLSPRVTEVRAEEVEGLRVGRDRLRVERLAGPAVELGHPREAWVCGIALAYAAGVRWPRLPTRREAAATLLWPGCALASGLALALALLDPLVAAQARGALPLVPPLGTAAFLAAAVLLGLLCQGAGVYLGSLAALVLLRPFFARAETMAWIDHSPLFWPPLGGAPGHLGLWCKALAILLYGPAPRAEIGDPRP